MNIPEVPVADIDADPHGVFRSFRRQTAVIRRSTGEYIVIRARNVEALMSDPRTRQIETELATSRGVESGPLFDFFRESMLFSNGPTHRRRRAPFSKAFSYRLIEAFRPRIRAVAEQLISRVLPRGEMSFLEDFSNPLPSLLICELLGIDTQDAERFRPWIYQMSRGLGLGYPLDELPQINAATAALEDYVHQLLLRRRADRRSDFLSSFLTSMEESEALSVSEAVSQIMTLILAGSDTTRAAFTMLVSLLLQHPEQWRALSRDPALIPGAVLEGLRYDSVVGGIARITLSDIEIDGHSLPANRIVGVSFIAALRDPELYSNPDEFNIHRTAHPPRHLAFGGGVHRCLGELLARAELEECLAVISQRLPDLHLQGEPARLVGYSGIRPITDMRVEW